MGPVAWEDSICRQQSASLKRRLLLPMPQFPRTANEGVLWSRAPDEGLPERFNFGLPDQ